MSSASEQRESAFSRCWREDMPRVLRYAQRQVGTNDARDVTAEVFAIAWRRWSEVPEPALPWLIGVARLVARATRRTLWRRHRLQSHLQLLHEVTAETGDADPTDRLEALRLLAGLSEIDREAILLTAWDGLSATEAAAVLGLTPAAFRKRLSRARQSLLSAETPSFHPTHRLRLEQP